MTPPHFCDYLPFEEDLALYLNNLESQLPKDDLYQVWLKLVCSGSVEEDFFQYMVFSPLHGPSQPPGTMM
jgi:hypothetical protein